MVGGGLVGGWAWAWTVGWAGDWVGGWLDQARIRLTQLSTKLKYEAVFGKVLLK